MNASPPSDSFDDDALLRAVAALAWREDQPQISLCRPY